MIPITDNKGQEGNPVSFWSCGHGDDPVQFCSRGDMVMTQCSSGSVDMVTVGWCLGAEASHVSVGLRVNEELTTHIAF